MNGFHPTAFTREKKKRGEKDIIMISLVSAAATIPRTHRQCTYCKRRQQTKQDP